MSGKINYVYLLHQMQSEAKLNTDKLDQVQQEVHESLKRIEQTTRENSRLELHLTTYQKRFEIAEQQVAKLQRLLDEERASEKWALAQSVTELKSDRDAFCQEVKEKTEEIQKLKSVVGSLTGSCVSRLPGVVSTDAGANARNLPEELQTLRKALCDKDEYCQRLQKQLDMRGFGQLTNDIHSTSGTISGRGGHTETIIDNQSYANPLLLSPPLTPPAPPPPPPSINYHIPFTTAKTPPLPPPFKVPTTPILNIYTRKPLSNSGASTPRPATPKHGKDCNAKMAAAAADTFREIAATYYDGKNARFVLTRVEKTPRNSSLADTSTVHFQGSPLQRGISNTVDRIRAKHL